MHLIGKPRCISLSPSYTTTRQIEPKLRISQGQRVSASVIFFVIYYQQDGHEAPGCRYCFYSWANFSVFSPHRDDTFHRSRWNSAKFHLDRLKGVSLCPQNFLKILNSTDIIAPKGRVSCTILTGFMRVLSLHNSAKFGGFSSLAW